MFGPMSIKRTLEIETLAVSRMICRIGLGRSLIIQGPMHRYLGKLARQKMRCVLYLINVRRRQP
ncbi:MAG: hypothetical protein C7B45_17720 [Sulfobacillus acidophilus]|uniref:Uncharacterized protein n=1 Tax=Sulfobacillus acidophilus TaxID=53633 RepID=A0A2T2WCD1_9FIRM|nr:MAG: hypothetical protein C7B45_17720 [Sulfobacillus acidophilus]